MPAYFRLQDLCSISAAGDQRIEEAIDVGAFKTLVVQCRKPVTGNATLSLQHAAVLEEDAFADIASPDFDLTQAGSEVETFEDCLRYVRWSISSYTSGTPQFAAVQPVAPTASAGQRFQVQFWPTPTACTLKYQYRVRVDKISSSNPYPYGGTDHSETILESCLAKAESRVEESQGVHKAEFMERSTALAERVKSAEPLPGERIVLPGEQGDAAAEEARSAGKIEIADAIWNELCEFVDRG